MWTRRQMLLSSLLASPLLLWRRARGQDGDGDPAQAARPGRAGAFTPVVTLDGATLEPTIKNGVKEYHLVAEAFEQEFAPDMKVRCWGYNGRTPGPTIEAVEGDRVRILVTNRLPEHTTVHWHGI
ncbi:MAG: multicopper oxidase domain-containing protein, partial [Planctomycetes bacterium]|nr:multicopper oxidase domain-containing protein [Planctomycetota bacterium]